MSKKGAFIYQQIEQTTAEWADNVTVYPASANFMLNLPFSKRSNNQTDAG